MITTTTLGVCAGGECRQQGQMIVTCFAPRAVEKKRMAEAGVGRMAILDRVVREGLPEKAHTHVQSRIILTKNKRY